MNLKVFSYFHSLMVSRFFQIRMIAATARRIGTKWAIEYGLNMTSVERPKKPER